MTERYGAVTEITDELCRQHLNDEYADLSRKMAAALTIDRPSPLESGRARSWAAGIVYALGRVNFLSDSSRESHMTMSELCEKIGVSQGNASAKSREIWSRLGLMQLHPGRNCLSPSPRNRDTGGPCSSSSQTTSTAAASIQ